MTPNPLGKAAKSGAALLTCWIFMLLPHTSFAQSTCATATNINDSLCTSTLTTSDSSVWYYFVASRSSGEIQLYNDSVAPAAYGSIELYSGICSGLARIDSSRWDAFGCILDYTGLTVSSTYYFKLSKSGTTNATYMICFSSLVSPNCGSCPTTGCQQVCGSNFDTFINHPTNTSGLDDINFADCWANPNGTDLGTSDYFNSAMATAYSHPDVSVPSNAAGYEPAHSGIGYAGIVCYYNQLTSLGTQYREYVTGHLANPLQAGTYTVSFWVSLADNSGYAVGKLGAYLSSSAPTQFSYSIILVTPQIVETPIISQDSGWTLVTGTFTAAGGEQYITIGEFTFDAAEPRTTHTPATTNGYNVDNFAYYYIDDVTVEPNLSLSITQQPDTACLNFPVTLTANANPTTPSCVWTSSNGGISCNNALCSDITFTNTVTTSTTFQAVATFFPGCTDTAYYTFTPSVTNLLADAGTDLNMCKDSSITLSGTANASATSFTWSVLNASVIASGTTNPLTTVVSPTVTTDYLFTAYDSRTGCSDQDTVTVFVAALAPIIDTSLITYGCDKNAGYFVTNYDPSNTYTWTVTDASFTPITFTQPFTNLIYVDWVTQTASNGGYVIVAETNAIGCIGVDTLFIKACCVNPLNGNKIYNETASHIVSPGQYSNVDLYINGFFIVDENLVFHTSTFNMGPNAKIIVTGGHTLELDETIVRAGCCEMWDAIIGDSLLDSVIVHNDSYIGDGLRGVVSNHGSVFRFYDHVTCNRNYVSITVNPYAGVHGGSVQETTFSSEDILFCQTVPKGTLLPPYTGQWPLYGIYVTGVDSITIGNPASAAYANTFKHLRYGIRTVKTNAKVFNNNFIEVDRASQFSKAVWASGKLPTIIPFNLTQYKIIVGGTTLGISERNYFADCPIGVFTDTAMSTIVNGNHFEQTVNVSGIGVRVQNCTGLVRAVDVINDTFYYFKTAVYLNQNNNCNTRVWGNYIEAGPVPCTGVYANGNGNNAGTLSVYLNDIHDVQYGVWLGNIKKATADNNFIYVRPTSSAIFNARGVSAVNCVGVKITNNQIWPVNVTGPTITTNWVGGVYFSHCSGALVSCNVINKLCYGIQAAGSGSTNATVFNNQMTKTYRGIWLSNGAIIGQQGSSTVANDNNWNTISTNRLYTSGTPPTNGLASPFYYRVGATYSPLPSGNAFGSFSIPTYILAAGLSVQPCSYVPIPSGSGGPNGLIANGQVTFTNNQDAGTWLSRESLYRLFEIDTFAIHDSLLMVYKDSADASNLGLLIYGLAINSTDTLDPNDAKNALDSITAITPFDNVEQHYQTVEKIMLYHQLNGDTLTADEIDTLRVIAALCPFTEGNAVYLARGVLAPYDTTEYQNDCDTADGTYNRMANPFVEQGIPFKLYPNPSNGTISIEYELSELETGTLQIFTMTGAFVLSVPLESGKQVKTVALSQLQAGVYIYKVMVNGEMREVDRLVIIE